MIPATHARPWQSHTFTQRKNIYNTHLSHTQLTHSFLVFNILFFGCSLDFCAFLVSIMLHRNLIYISPLERRRRRQYRRLRTTDHTNLLVLRSHFRAPSFCNNSLGRIFWFTIGIPSVRLVLMIYAVLSLAWFLSSRFIALRWLFFLSMMNPNYFVLANLWRVFFPNKQQQ